MKSTDKHQSRPATQNTTHTHTEKTWACIRTTRTHTRTPFAGTGILITHYSLLTLAWVVGRRTGQNVPFFGVDNKRRGYTATAYCRGRHTQKKYMQICCAGWIERRVESGGETIFYVKRWLLLQISVKNVVVVALRSVRALLPVIKGALNASTTRTRASPE